MSNIISIHYLLQFLIFINIIPISITIETQLQFAFLNGLNIIRCSDNQVQIYQSNSDSDLYLSTILNCDNKNDILSTGYAGFVWNKLKLICSSQLDQIHEEQFIIRTIASNKGIKQLPDAQGQLGQSIEPYELHMEYSADGKKTIIRSNDQPANNGYFNKNTNSKERRIYIWFQEHPIICRIKFTGEENNPCPAQDDQEVENVEHVCYYNPGAEEEPTIKEMEAELKQIEEEAQKPDNTLIYTLNLEKPDITPDDPSNPSKPFPSSNFSRKEPVHKTPVPKNSSTTKNESNILKTIGLILGILLLIALIGGIGFYMIQKHRLNKSSSLSSPTMIENGDKKGLSSVAPNESHQSLVNDTNRDISMNEPSKKEKPTLELQTPNANKRQRTGTTMVFNEDI